jgi:multidrug efflux pump subunit AcrA (membrane-fusion protein)
MSFIQQLQNISGRNPVNRRRALLGLSLLALAACSRATKEDKAADSKAAYYTCTMHPFVRSQDPKGKCPVCGMDLVPVYKSSPDNSTANRGTTNAALAGANSSVDADGMVNLAPERMQEIGVTTEVVTRRNLTRMLHAPARAEIDESSLRDINVRVGAGYITKLYANAEGVSFRKGQPLMTVLCDGSRSFDVPAPFDGYVHMKKAIDGMRFEAGQSLLVLADHSHVWIVAQFSEDQAMYVNVGQKMTVTFPSMPQHAVKGEISFINPHVDDQQRRITARIVIPDEGHMFHPGLFAEVSGEVTLGEALTVSTEAVIPTGGKFIVFVDHGGGKLEPREIEIGTHSDDYDEVVSGLNEGDRVVSSANFLIDAESRIQGVLKTWGDRP